MQISGGEVAVYRNCDMPTCETGDKRRGNYRWSVNFIDIDPAFDFQINYVKLLRSIRPLSAHIHENSAEIVYRLHGEQYYNIDGKDFRVLGGELLLSAPGTVHTSSNIPEQKGDFYYLTINPACLRDALFPFPDEDETIKKLTEMLSGKTAVYYYSDIRQITRLAEGLKRTYISDCSCKKTRIRNLVTRLLLFTMDVVETKPVRHTHTGFIERVYKYIDEHICEKLTVEKVANHFMYSKSTFQKIFQRYSHMTVHQYIMVRKIEAAKKMMLETAGNPYDVWETLSFSSQCYFGQVFKKYTGMTVTQYLDRMKSENK